MGKAENGVEQLFQHLASRKNELGFASIRGFAPKINGKFELSLGRIDFFWGQSRYPEIVAETEFCLGFSTTLSSIEAMELLKNALKSEVFILPGLPQVTVRIRKSRMDGFFHDFWSGLSSDWPRKVSLSLDLEQSKHEENFIGSAKLKFLLRAANPPFDGFEDLFATIGLPHGDALSRATLEISAFSPIEINKEFSYLRDEKLSVQLKTSSDIDLHKVTVGYRNIGLDSADRGLVPLKHTLPKAGTLEFEHSPFQGAACQIFANYEGQNLDIYTLFDLSKHQSPVTAIIAAFDKGLSYAKQFLSGDSNNPSKDFETGVAYLFSMLGYSVIQLGLTPKLTDGPDLVAITPAFEIAVIECTTLDLNHKQKLSKLIQRTVLIQQSLERSGYRSPAIQPVIVTALCEAQVKADLNLAVESGVSVISKEQLEILFAKAQSMPDPISRFKELKGFIPDGSRKRETSS